VIALLDTTQSVETPEGIELDLRIAGPAPRALAWFLDTLIRGAIFWVATIALGVLGKFGTGLWLILLFLLWWFYPLLFEVLREGATPGKKALGIYVAGLDGTPVGWGPSLVRNLLRSVDFLPVLYGLGLATMLLNDRFQRLGDIAAGTVVLYRSGETRRYEVPQVTAIAPPIALSPEEAQAILNFAERAPRLTAERAAELASLAKPLMAPQHPQDVRRVLGIARWLAGER
jgi:uncharacterized RDD family membrane protein YckC